MAIAFREADRLWMLSKEGFECDLRRDIEKFHDKTKNNELASHRIKHVIERYKDERKLYSSSNERFQDEYLFFRTKAGFDLYLKYVKERKNQYKIDK